MNLSIIYKILKNLLFWTILSSIGSLILFANLKYPTFVINTYSNQNFDLLNKLSFTKGERSIDYYLGKIEDASLGPVTNFLTHMLFAAFCLFYIKHLNVKNFCLSVFIFLLISKFNVLFYPPYGDAVGGPFAEAIWLYKNNFDYAGLFNQPTYNFGGPRVYFFSLYPTYLALLYKFIPSIKYFLIINHILVYYMAAVIVALTRKILSIKYNRYIATLGSIILLALPLFQSQTEAINMEMPCLLFSMLAVSALIEKKNGLAVIFAVLAAFVKGHGIIICGVVFIICFMQFFIDEKWKGKKRLLFYCFLALLSALFMVASKYIQKDQHVSAGLISPLSGFDSLKKIGHTYVYISSFVLFLVLLFFSIGKRVKMNGNNKGFFNLLFNDYYAQIIVFLTAGMWYLLFLNFSVVSPRYMLEVMPFVLMCVFFTLSFIYSKIKTIFIYLLIIMISYTALSSYGWSHKGQDITYHVLTEKNLQYRNDLKLNIKMIEYLQKNFIIYTIGSPFILAQMIAMPEMGYVERPFDVIVYGMKIKYADIKNFTGIENVNIFNTLWIGVPADFQQQNSFTYPYHRTDKIIKELELGDNKVTLFMGGIAIDKVYKINNMLKLKKYLATTKTRTHD